MTPGTVGLIGMVAILAAMLFWREKKTCPYCGVCSTVDIDNADDCPHCFAPWTESPGAKW